MSALDMGITAPCPFCGSRDAPDVVEDGDDVYAQCESCLAQGPPTTRIGCREEDEDESSDLDLEREALELWNDRGQDEDITVEQIYDLCPALAASIAELEAKDPKVLASRKALDMEVDNLNARAKHLKEKQILPRHRGPQGDKE
jgi:hypothetical protein